MSNESGTPAKLILEQSAGLGVAAHLQNLLPQASVEADCERSSTWVTLTANNALVIWREHTQDRHRRTKRLYAGIRAIRTQSVRTRKRVLVQAWRTIRAVTDELARQDRLVAVVGALGRMRNIDVSRGWNKWRTTTVELERQRHMLTGGWNRMQLHLTPTIIARWQVSRAKCTPHLNSHDHLAWRCGDPYSSGHLLTGMEQAESQGHRPGRTETHGWHCVGTAEAAARRPGLE